LEDVGADGIILNWILSRIGQNRPDSSHSKVTGSCDLGNELTGFIKCGKYHKLLKKDSTLWNQLMDPLLSQTNANPVA
jgi:hypothetical protein